jgi:hypothetical protein
VRLHPWRYGWEGFPPAEIAKLKGLAHQKRAKEIAEELGKSLGSTRAKAQRPTSFDCAPLVRRRRNRFGTREAANTASTSAGCRLSLKRAQHL